MKHRVGFNRLSRRQGHLKALKNNMVTSLFRYERVETTKAKALEVRRVAEKMVTRARVDSVHNRRLIGQRIHDQEVLAKLFTDIAPRYLERPGGYTRVLKIGRRQGDAAEMVILELVDRKIEEKPVREKPAESAKEEPAIETKEAPAAAESDGAGEATEEEAPKARVGGTKGTKAPTKKAASKKAPAQAQSEDAAAETSAAEKAGEAVGEPEAKAEEPEAKAEEPEAKAEEPEAKAEEPEAKTDEPPAKAEKADSPEPQDESSDKKGEK